MPVRASAIAAAAGAAGDGFDAPRIPVPIGEESDASPPEIFNLFVPSLLFWFGPHPDSYWASAPESNSYWAVILNFGQYGPSLAHLSEPRFIIRG